MLSLSVKVYFFNFICIFCYLSKAYSSTPAIHKKGQPMTKYDNWMRDAKVQLFAHNHMSRENEAVDPFQNNAGTGVGGRILDILKRNGYHTSANSVDGARLMVKGDTYYGNVSWIWNRNAFFLLLDIFTKKKQLIVNLYQLLKCSPSGQLAVNPFKNLINIQA